MISGRHSAPPNIQMEIPNHPAYALHTLRCPSATDHRQSETPAAASP